jgi:hypothetical protein
MDYQVEIKYQKLLKLLEKDFDGGMDIQAILFLIGVNELGTGYQKFKKNEKTDLLHVAVCTVLMPYGYYEFKGRDEENWPHFELIKKLPPLEGKEQQHLLKEAIIEYFLSNGYFQAEDLQP